MRWVAVLVVMLVVMSGVGIEVKAEVPSSGKWTVMQVDPSWGRWGSIAVDSKGDPHIAYGDTYASFDGVGWGFETLTGCPGGVISLALDKNDAPHVSISAGAPNSTVNSAYGNKTQGYWQYCIVDKYIGAFGGSIAIAPNQSVHIVYNAGSIGIRYVQIVNGTIISDTVDSDMYSVITTPDSAIAIDSKGIPHVGYLNGRSAPPAKVQYANYDKGSWNLSTIDAKDGGGGQSQSLFTKIYRI